MPIYYRIFPRQHPRLQERGDDAVRRGEELTSLKDTFSSTHEMLDEMRSIRCIGHKGKAKFITPFVGSQLDICEAFGFDVPQCFHVYVKKEGAEETGAT